MGLVLPWTLYQNNDSDPNETVILGCDCFTVIDLHGCSQMQHRGHQRGGMDAARTLEVIQFEDGKVTRLLRAGGFTACDDCVVAFGRWAKAAVFVGFRVAVLGAVQAGTSPK